MNGKGSILAAVLLLTLLVSMIPAAQQADAAGGIFAAAGEGGGVPIEESAAAKPSEDRPDTVRTLAGDILKAKVVGIDADGILTMTGPQFVGKAALRASALDVITLHCTRTESGRDEVRLTNGDRICGTLHSITPQAVVLKTDTAGPLKVVRDSVVYLGLRGKGTPEVLLETDFANGKMGPWKVRNGDWAVTRGQLTCSSSGGIFAVQAELDQEEALTFVVKVRSLSGPRVEWWAVLFSNDSAVDAGHQSVNAGFYTSQVVIGCSYNGRHIKYRTVPYGQSMQAGTLRFAYDPKTGKVRAWLDSVDLGEYTSPHRPNRGRYVLFQTRYASQVSLLRILRGVVPPSGAPEIGAAEGEEETDLVVFRNTDRVSAESVTMSEGNFAIKSAYGKLTVAAEKINYVLFRRDGQVRPRRLKGDVQVRTSTARMTLKLRELSAEHLLGTSSSLGEVTLKRDAIKSIGFHLPAAVEKPKKKLLYLKEGNPSTWTAKGRPLQQHEEIERWKSAGYGVTTRDMTETVLTPTLLGQYDVLRFNGSHYFSKRKITDEEGKALYRWVLNGGRFFADVYGGSPVLLAKRFGVERIESSQRSGRPWPYYHGAPLTVGPVSSDVFSVDRLAAEQLDRVYLAPEHYLTVAARFDGYPAVVYGRFDGGKVVIVFLGNWSHDATNPGNAYKATLFQHGNLKFLEQAIQYLGE